MLIISKVFTILCLLKLSEQSSKLFFQMSAKWSEREGLFEMDKHRFIL